jgi:hypothetical protein
MTPDEARAMYRRQIANGQTVTLRRVSGAMQTVVATVTVRARVTAYSPEEMVGGFQQGDQRIVFLAEDIGAFPVPIRADGSRDQIVIGSSVFGVYAVDNRTRSVAGELIAYELRVRGAG